MRFALIGADSDTWPLVEAVEQNPEHALAAVYDLSTADPRLLRYLDAEESDSWESVLHGTVCDAVIVAHGDTERREDQLRKLVQAGTHLLVVHPACPAIIGYELEMIRRDTGKVIAAYFPGQLHPELSRLKALVEQTGAGSLGTVEQLVFERSLEDRSRDQVLAALARDAAIIRAVLGRLQKVSAVGGQPGLQQLGNLSVQMTTPSGAIARWSVVPAMGQPGGTLQVIGSLGKARLSMPEQTELWQLQVDGAEPPENRPQSESWNGPAAFLQYFAACVRGESASDWLDSCRDIEVAETAVRSAERGRTYELHYEEHREEDTFKGLMAVGGCAILLFTLLLWITAAMVEGVFLGPDMTVTDATSGPGGEVDQAPPASGAPSPLVQIIRYWPVCPFVLFLLLQLFWLVFRGKSAGTR